MPRRKGSPRRLPTTIPTRTRSLEAWHRACEALRLKTEEKLSYREIAERLGYKSPASVYEAVQRVLRFMPSESVQDLRSMESEKLDRLEKQLDELIFAQGGDKRFVARNVEVAVKVMERRAKLMGIDAPEKHDVNVAGPTVIEYVRDEKQDDHKAKAKAIIEGDFTELATLDPELAALAESFDIDDGEGGAP